MSNNNEANETSSNGSEKAGLSTSNITRRGSLHNNHPVIVNSKKYVEPPDGGWGWIIVAGVWLDNVLVIGMLKSFGVLFPAFRSYFEENAAAISWINSISLSMRATAGKNCKNNCL
ncbi:unnamed protein product [Clavelina lepadiformis]|uniref:Uncharacterized protein n=1 Tax=Clavelina lepadiformis TaxID=159417 RepID=A0ABP0GDZ7_CLALP